MKSNLFVLLIVLICVAGAAYHFHPEYFKSLSPATGTITTTPAPTTTGTVAVTATPSLPSSRTETAPVAPVSTPTSTDVTPAPVARIFTPPNPLPQKDDWTWTTTDGKTYSKVKISKVEADCVTILDSDGGARVDISTLPADVQAMLNYDPELAQEAALKRKGPVASDAKPTPAGPAAPTIAVGGPRPITDAAGDPTDPRQKMEKQLDDLRADIKQKEKELLDNQTAEANGSVFLGDTREAIKQEKIQEQALVDKLAGH